MVRKMVELDDAQAGALKRIAARRCIPEAQVLHEAVAGYLTGLDTESQGLPEDNPLWDIVGIGKHGPANGSTTYKHDLYGGPEPAS